MKEKELLEQLMRMGFCQPKFYKRSVWEKANALMKALEGQGLVYACDMGRGKGKWSTYFSYDYILDATIIDKEVDTILTKYDKYLKRLENN